MRTRVSTGIFFVDWRDKRRSMVTDNVSETKRAKAKVLSLCEQGSRGDGDNMIYINLLRRIY